MRSVIPALRTVQAHLFRDAVCFKDVNYSYGQLLHASESIASKLPRGKTVAAIMPPSIGYVATMLGTWKNDGVFVPLHPGHPLPELEYFIRDSGSDMVVVDKRLTDRVIPLLNRLRISHLGVSDTYTSENTSEFVPKQWEVDSNNSALIIYTSGTTGRPKGVVHTHQSLDAQVNTMLEPWEWSADDRILHTLPLHHIHGIVNALLCPLKAGACVEFLSIDEPMKSFNAEAVWERWRDTAKKPTTMFMAVPAMYSQLMEHFDKQTVKEQRKMRNAIASYGQGGQRIRVFISGSSPLSVSRRDKWFNLMTDGVACDKSRDPDTLFQRATILERYGMSELGMVLSNPLRGDRVAGSVGQPLPGVEVKLVNDGEQVDKVGVSGELYVKGDTLFKHYHRLQKETEESFDGEWFKTGDTAMKMLVNDAVSFQILGRTSVDILKIKGYKVSAVEVERALNDHHSVKESCVLGVHDNEQGEDKMCALVVLNDSSDVNEIKAWLKERIAYYKVPSVLQQVNKIPVNSMGKVNKKALSKSIYIH